MSEQMTLEQVRDWHKQIRGDLAGPLASKFHKDCEITIDAHLAQHAAMVDALRRQCGHDSRTVDGCLMCEAADFIENRTRSTWSL